MDAKHFDVILQSVVTIRELKNLRKERNMTQKEFAEALHVSIDTIQNWEQGRRKPSLMALKVIKAALDILLRQGV